MSRELHRRLGRLEGGDKLARPVEMVDAPPSETREEWLDRHRGGSGNATAINARGETRAQWLERTRLQLDAMLGASNAIG